MSKYLEFLEELDTLLTPETWTRVVSARDAQGRMLHPTDDEACSWCLFGGIQRVGTDFPYSVRVEVQNKFIERIDDSNTRQDTSVISRWNDAGSRTFSEVKSLIAAVREDFKC